MLVRSFLHSFILLLVAIVHSAHFTEPYSVCSLVLGTKFQAVNGENSTCPHGASILDSETDDTKPNKEAG